MSFGFARRPRSASVRSAVRRSSGWRWTSTRGAVVWSMVMAAFLPEARPSGSGLRVGGEPEAAEHPAAGGWEEVAIRGAGVARRRDARAAAQHHLAAHELAVVLTDRARGR